jgi:hypothetical protein
MNKDEQQNNSNGPRPGWARAWRAAGVVAALALTALLAAACGGGGSSGSSSDQNMTAQLEAFASCVRSHGIPGFYFTRQTGTPSPPPAGTAPGAVMARNFNGYSVEFDPSSPVFEAAEKACLHLAPFFDRTPPRESHQEFLQALKSVDCLRSHGYPNWPDPPHELGVSIPAGVDTSTPQFQAADKTCRLGAPPGG